MINKILLGSSTENFVKSVTVSEEHGRVGEPGSGSRKSTISEEFPNGVVGLGQVQTEAHQTANLVSRRSSGAASTNYKPRKDYTQVFSGDRFIPVSLSSQHLVWADNQDLLDKVLETANAPIKRKMSDINDQGGAESKLTFNQKLESGIKNLVYNSLLGTNLFGSGLAGSKKTRGFKEQMRFRQKHQKARLMSFVRKLKTERSQADIGEPDNGLSWRSLTICGVPPLLGKLKNETIRVLDAPDLPEDPFTQLVDWSCYNKFYLAIGSTVYEWCPTTLKSSVVMVLEMYTVSALKCHPTRPELVVVGINGEVWLCSTKQAESEESDQENRMIAKIGGGFSFITAQTTCVDVYEDIAAIGSRVFGVSIVRLDQEQKSPDMLHLPQKLQDGIAGVSFSPNGRHLAVGNCLGGVGLYRIADQSWVFCKAAHEGPVRALAWSPKNSDVFVTGSTGYDQKIVIWNALTGEIIRSLETSSQVFSLRYAYHFDVELLLTSLGSEENVVNVIYTDTYQKIGEFVGHTKPILHMATNPDSSILVTASADESIRFWNLFPSVKSEKLMLKSTSFPLLCLR